MFTMTNAAGSSVTVGSPRELQYWAGLGYVVQGATFDAAMDALTGINRDYFTPNPVNNGVVADTAVAALVANGQSATGQALRAASVAANAVALAANPDTLIAGAITRDANGTATSAPVAWPDGDPGQYTATTLSSSFPGAVDAYTITKGNPVKLTFTQPAVTRDANGAVTDRPALVVA